MTPSHDQEFLQLVRRHLEPVLLDAGFVFNEVAVGAGPVTAPLVRESRWGRLSRLLLRRHAGKASARAMTTTSVLYEADAQEFAAAYPRSEERPESRTARTSGSTTTQPRARSTSTSRVRICTSETQPVW